MLYLLSNKVGKLILNAHAVEARQQQHWFCWVLSGLMQSWVVVKWVNIDYCNTVRYHEPTLTDCTAGADATLFKDAACTLTTLYIFLRI